MNWGRRTHSECPTVFRSSVWVHFELHRITMKGAWYELSFSKWFHITVIKLVLIIYLILLFTLIKSWTYFTKHEPMCNLRYSLSKIVLGMHRMFGNWKKWQNKPTWGEKKCEKPCSVFGLRPSVSFCSASAKNFHFGASLHFIVCYIPYHSKVWEQ